MTQSRFMEKFIKETEEALAELEKEGEKLSSIIIKDFGNIKYNKIIILKEKINSQSKKFLITNIRRISRKKFIVILKIKNNNKDK